MAKNGFDFEIMITNSIMPYRILHYTTDLAQPLFALLILSSTSLSLFRPLTFTFIKMGNKETLF